MSTYCLEARSSMDYAEKEQLRLKAKMLLGIPAEQINADAATAIQCAMDMGYRTAGGIAEMARKMMNEQRWKKFEEFREGMPGQLLEEMKRRAARGEFVVLVAPKSE